MACDPMVITNMNLRKQFEILKNKTLLIDKSSIVKVNEQEYRQH